MDQNQTVDNDLQKAIDDITNTTNTDPVFSDPVAAPSSIPEGDTGELSAPVGPFPNDPQVEIPTATPEPIAPLESVNIPELTAPEIEPAPAPEIKDAALPPEPETKEPEIAPAPEITPEPEKATETVSNLTEEEKQSAKEIKEAALHELLPILDKTNADPTQKFNICKDALEDLKDQTALQPAYKAAKEISDETERAEALLYLVESIDKM